MKKLLILSYYFPPLGLGGTQRVAKFTKYLPEFGWSPTVITVKPIAYWAQDLSLLTDLKDIRIIRTESDEPQRLLLKYKRINETNPVHDSITKNNSLLQKLNKNVFSFFLVPDSKLLWNRYVFKAVERLQEQEYFDALFTTSPPHSTHLVGKKIAKTFGMKWVADFRDDWAGGHIVYEPTTLHRWLNKQKQKSVIQAADAVICVSNGIKAVIEKKTNSGEKFNIITNGYDESDFSELKINDYTDKYVFCYCGVISKYSDPTGLLQALKIMKEKYSFTFAKLKFRFVGHDATGEMAGMVESFGLGDIIDLIGFKPHSEALKYLVNADALLLLATGKTTDTFIPGKTFEYLGAKKPVFCISNVTDTNNLLGQYSMAHVIDPDNPEAIANHLNSFIEQKWTIQQRDIKFIQQFNRKNQTKQLAEILDRL